MTEADLVAALLEAAQAKDENGEAGGMTTAQIIEKTGLSEKLVLKRLRRLKAEGRLAVYHGYIVSLDGHRRRVPHYRLVNPN